MKVQASGTGTQNGRLPEALLNGGASSPAAIVVPEGGVYLTSFLEPIRCFLDADNVSEVVLNEPGCVWVEKMGSVGMERHEIPALDKRHIQQMATRAAAISSQSVNESNPLLSTALPTGERLQVVLPPCARLGGAFAIRRQVVRDLSLDDYAAAGAFAEVTVTGEDARSQDDRELAGLLDRGQIQEFIAEAVRLRKNILISGGTTTGKSTFLNSISKEIPGYERLVTIEDTPELDLHQANTLSLIASKGDQGTARVSVDELLQAALRLRPDRLLLGELRGEEAYSFLRAVNTGHPGSISTLHADSPLGAFEQVALMVLQSGKSLRRDEIMAYIHSVVEVVVQLKRSPEGRRFVSEVYFAQATR